MSASRIATTMLLRLVLAASLLPGCEDRPSSELNAARTRVADQTAPQQAALEEAPARASGPTAEPIPAYQPAAAHAWDGQPGSELPAYTAQALDGTAVSLADLRGQPLLLNFWATWCVPCRLEFEELAALQTRFAASGLRVVGVSLDHQIDASELTTWSQSQGLSYTVWHDPSGEVATFGVPPVPGNFVFDRQGRLAFSAIGAPPGSLEALVRAVEEVVTAP